MPLPLLTTLLPAGVSVLSGLLGSKKQTSSSGSNFPWGELVLGGTSLLSTLLAGAAAGKEKEKERKYAEKIRQETISALKPAQPYFQSNALPWISDVLQKAILGNLESRISQDVLTRWGINPEEYRQVLGFNLPFAQSSTAQQYYPQPIQSQIPIVGGNRPFEDYLINRFKGGRYGL
jgi:hypothetical protein